jgi:hypothetical protein
MAWRAFGDDYKRQSIKIPKRFLTNMSKISFLGKDYLCPNPVEEYLTFQYGKDWRIPVRTADKQAYLSDQFRIQQTIKDKVIQRIRALPRRVQSAFKRK